MMMAAPLCLPESIALVYKVFEGGGGFNGGVRILNPLTGGLYTADEITVSLYPTMTSVPGSLGDFTTFPTGITRQGYVNPWLILGVYNQGGGANPGLDNMMLDYLTDGEDVTQENILPRG